MKQPLLKTKGVFGQFAKVVSFATGQPWAFGIAVLVVATWALTGPLFHFSDTWQLVINTSTTIVTFLMVFLIQNTQNRDAQAMHLKMDELIRAMKGAHTAVIDSEELTESEIAHIKAAYSKLAEGGRKAIRQGRTDTGTPQVMIELFGDKPKN